MSGRHLIDELVFEIHFDRRDAALQSDAYLSALLTKTLLPIVDEVLNRYDDPDTVLTLPSLTLDLGDIPRADFAQQIAQRLRAALDDALQRALPLAKVLPNTEAPLDEDRGGQGSIRSRMQSDLDQLAHFLDTGRLAWHADTAQGRAHEIMLDRLLTQAGDSLWMVLGRALRHPASTRRLLEQFPQRQLLAILRHSAPAHADGLLSLMGDLRLLVREQAFPRINEPQWEHLVWQHVLIASVLRPAVSIAPHALCAEIICALSVLAGQAYPQLLAALDGITAKNRQGVDLPVLRPIFHALHEALKANGDAQVLSARPSQAVLLAPQSAMPLPVPSLIARPAHAAQGNALDQLSGFLDTGRLPRPSELEPALPDEALLDRLLTQSADSFWSMLAGALSHPASARRLLDQFSQRQLLAILRRSVPAHADGLLGLIEELQQLCRAQVFPGISEAQLMRLAWQHVLTASVTRPMASIVPHAICAEIIGALALLASQTYSQLLRELNGITAENRLGIDLPVLRPILNALHDAAHTAVDAGAVPAPLSRGTHPGLKNPSASKRVSALSSPHFFDAALLAPQSPIPSPVPSSIARPAYAAQGNALEQLSGFLDTGRLPWPSEFEPDLNDEALLDRLLDRLLTQADDSLWSMLARALSHPASARRLLEQFSPRQLLAILRRSVPAHADSLLGLIEELQQLGRAQAFPGMSEAQLARLAWQHVLTASVTRPMASVVSHAICAEIIGALALLASQTYPQLLRALNGITAGNRRGLDLPMLRPILNALHDAAHTGVDAGAVPLSRTAHPGLGSPSASERVSAPASLHFDAAFLAPQSTMPSPVPSLIASPASASPVDALEQLSGFLDTGRLPRPSELEPELPDEALLDRLLDRLLTQADDSLWSMLARALSHPASARRLLEQFSPCQLLAILRHSAPAHADVLLGLIEDLQQLGRAQAFPGMSEAQVARLTWQHVLAASVMRPLASIVPQALCAEIIGVLALLVDQSYPQLLTVLGNTPVQDFAVLGPILHALHGAEDPVPPVLTQARPTPALRKRASKAPIPRSLTKRELPSTAWRTILPELRVNRALHRLRAAVSQIQRNGYSVTNPDLPLPTMATGAVSPHSVSDVNLVAHAVTRPDKALTARQLTRWTDSAFMRAQHRGSVRVPARVGSRFRQLLERRTLSQRENLVATEQTAFLSSVVRAIGGTDFPRRREPMHRMSSPHTDFAQHGTAGKETVNKNPPFFLLRATETAPEKVQVIVRCVRSLDNAFRRALKGRAKGGGMLRQGQRLALFLSDECAALERILTQSAWQTTPSPIAPVDLVEIVDVSAHSFESEPATQLSINHAGAHDMPAMEFEADQIAVLAQQLHQSLPTPALNVLHALNETALRQLINAYVSTDSAVSAAHRTVLLDSIDDRAAEASDKARFLRRTLEHLSRHEALDLDAILAASVENIPLDAQASAPPSMASPASSTANLRNTIASALIAGDFAILQKHWHSLLTDQAPVLRQALLHYGRSTALRQGLIRAFPDSMLGDIVGLFAPDIARVISAILAQPALFNPATTWSEWKTTLWTLALTELLATEGVGTLTNFSERVLLPLAGSDRARHAALIQACLTALQAGRAPATWTALASRLTPLSHSVEQPVNQASDTTHVTKMEQIRQILNNFVASDAANEGGVDLVLATIAEHATLALDPPDYFNAVLRALQDQREPDLAALILAQTQTPADGPSPQSDAAATDAAGTQVTKLRQLIADTLTRSSTDGSASPTYLLTAIDEHAELASDPAAYLYTVLTALQENRELDLEAMLHDPASTAHPMVTDPPVPKIRRPDPQYRSEPMSEFTETMLIANAGMVLAAPYLPRLFDALNLTQDGSFIDEPAAERAVHLLQFMVNGQSRSPEYQLTLNKLLCGLASAAPVVAGIDITPREQATIEGMIEAIIAHWKTIGKTSIDGLRQSFLARKGDLQLLDEAWQLHVHPGSFDMLLDRLPWGYSIIKYPWMARPLHVTWR